MSRDRLSQQFSLLTQHFQAQQVETTLEHLSELLSCTRRNCRMVLQKMEQRGWLSWHPEPGRGKQSQLNFYTQDPRFDLEKVEAAIAQQRWDQAFELVEHDWHQISQLLYRHFGPNALPMPVGELLHEKEFDEALWHYSPSLKWLSRLLFRPLLAEHGWAWFADCQAIAPQQWLLTYQADVWTLLDGVSVQAVLDAFILLCQHPLLTGVIDVKAHPQGIVLMMHVQTTDVSERLRQCDWPLVIQGQSDASADRPIASLTDFVLRTSRYGLGIYQLVQDEKGLCLRRRVSMACYTPYIPDAPNTPQVATSRNDKGAALMTPVSSGYCAGSSVGPSYGRGAQNARNQIAVSCSKTIPQNKETLHCQWLETLPLTLSPSTVPVAGGLSFATSQWRSYLMPLSRLGQHHRLPSYFQMAPLMINEWSQSQPWLLAQGSWQWPSQMHPLANVNQALSRPIRVGLFRHCAMAKTLQALLAEHCDQAITWVWLTWADWPILIKGSSRYRLDYLWFNFQGEPTLSDYADLSKLLAMQAGVTEQVEALPDYLDAAHWHAWYQAQWLHWQQQHHLIELVRYTSSQTPWQQISQGQWQE